MPSTTRRRVLTGVGAAATLAAGSVSAAGTGDDRRALDDRGETVTLDGLEAFVDAEMTDLLEEYGVVGATVSVVHDGAVALSKGYGDADREGTPVDSTTAFRVGSISKLVTWTAAMRLVADGTLDPHADVNATLEEVTVPDAYDEPVTLAHLATHTAGFEDSARGIWAERASDVRPLAQALRETLPARVRPPGETAVYSNHGAALAGLLVADAAGRPFAEYAAEAVFEPLGMTDSTFAQPVPEGIDRSRGYIDGGLGGLMETPYRYTELPPTGGLHASADDMARFMLAHLHGGSLAATALNTDGRPGEGRVLPADATAEMHRQWHAAHGSLPGVAFGFIEGRHGDARVLMHNGSTPAFHSDLRLFPDHDLGVFVSFNTGSGAAARGEFVEAFVDEFVPADPDLPGEPTGQPARADEIAGTYRPLRVAQTTYEKALTVPQAGEVEVRVADDGALVTEGRGDPHRWIEVEPLLFAREDGGERLAFATGDGEPRLTFGSNPVGTHERVPRGETLAVQYVVTALTLVTLLSAVVGWPAAAAWRWFRGGRAIPPGTGRPRLLAGGAAVAFLLLPTGAVTLFLLDPIGTVGNPGLGFRALFGFPLVGVAGTLAAAWVAGRAWLSSSWSFGARVHYTAVVLALGALTGVYAVWNLLGIPA